MSAPSFVPANRSKKSGSSSRKTNKLFFIIAIAAAIIAAGAVLFMFLKISETVKYYVVSAPIAARSPIEPEMLTEVVSPIGSVPPNALSLEFITENDLYAAYALQEGEVVSTSVVQEYTPILADVPEGYVAVSMTIPADFAVAGKIARDNVVDVIATNSETNTTKVILRGVRVLDAAATLEAFDEDDEEVDSESGSIRGGIPSIYTVALTPEDAVKLSAVSQFQLTLVLTDPEEEQEEEVDIQINLADIFGLEGVGLSGGFPEPEGEDKELTEEEQAIKDALYVQAQIYRDKFPDAKITIGEDGDIEVDEDADSTEGSFDDVAPDAEGDKPDLAFYEEKHPDAKITVDEKGNITIDEGEGGITTIDRDSTSWVGESGE